MNLLALCITADLSWPPTMFFIEFIDSVDDNVNRNNLAALNPFVVTDLDGTPLSLTPPPAGVPSCPECDRRFGASLVLVVSNAQIRDMNPHVS